MVLGCARAKWGVSLECCPSLLRRASGQVLTDSVCALPRRKACTSSRSSWGVTDESSEGGTEPSSIHVSYCNCFCSWLK